MFADLFSIIAPVLFGVSVGYAWTKFGRAFDTAFATSLVFNIGTPLLVIAALTELNIEPAALAVMAFDYEVPNWLANTASIYGQLVISLMLIALRVRGAFSIGLGVGVVVVEFFDLGGVAEGLVIFQSAMPAAV